MASLDPWQAIAERLELGFYPRLGESFWVQLWILRWIYGAGAVFGVVGLLVRVNRGGVWLFRLERSSSGEENQRTNQRAMLTSLPPQAID